MWFRISRVSQTYKEQPCKEAVLIGDMWKIEIDTLADLMALEHMYGRLIITDYVIIIYDDYIE